MMIMHTVYLIVASTTLIVYVVSAVHHRAQPGGLGERTYLFTGAVLRLIDIVWAAHVPVRYMMFPPTVPERRVLLEIDDKGLYHARNKGWKKRDGGFPYKLCVQVVITLLLDWI